MANAHTISDEAVLPADPRRRDAADAARSPARSRAPGDVGASADLGKLGLALCFASAVMTLIGIGSALERMFL